MELVAGIGAILLALGSMVKMGACCVRVIAGNR